MRGAAGAALVVISSLTAAAQAPPVAPPVLNGEVVADSDGRPLANVRVSLESSGSDDRPAGFTTVFTTVFTDGFGRFTLSAPTQARYQIRARKAGYADAPLSLTPGQAPTQTPSIRMVAGAAISGRVADEVGEPVVAVRVIAEAPGGAQRFAETITDDRGEYRLPLQPGSPFVLSMETMGVFGIERQTSPLVTSISPSINRTYFPSAEEVGGATPLRLQPGEDRQAVDFMIPAARSGNQPMSAYSALPMLLLREPDEVAAATGVVEGRVVDAAGRGLAHAQVVLVPARGANGRIGRADGAGNFSFANVAEGSYRVSASKPGYATVENQQAVTSSAASSSASSMASSTDAPRERAELQLIPWAVVTGRVLDELGEPVQGARVQLLRTRFEAGRRRLVAAGSVVMPTDDRGNYRVYGLDAGRYVVSAQLGDVTSADVPGYTRSYYPGMPNASDAQIVTLARGQELPAIDILMARAPTFRLAGRLVDSAGRPTTGGNVQLWPSQGAGSTIGVPVGARIEDSGAFEFTNVPQGQYVIQAYRGRINNGGTEGEFGALSVTVADSDLTDLALQTSAGSAITGTVVFDAADRDTAERGREPARAGIEISPVPVSFETSPAGNWANVGVGPDWQFSILGVNGARRLAVTQVPPGWALKEIRAGGVDVTDQPLPFGSASQSLSDVEIVLTDRVSQVTGRVTDSRGRGVGDGRVVLFSTDRRRWYPLSRYLRRATPQVDGRFSVAGLPADDYYVAVLAELPEGGADAWQESSLLEDVLTRATVVTVTEGQSVAVELRR